MEKKLLNIAITPLIYNNKILLLRREKSPFKGLWGMPGGKLEFGEHIGSAVEREIFEETGLNVKFKGISAVLSEVFFDKKTQEDYWHAILFLCQVNLDNISGVKESSEGRLRWVDLNNLPKTEIIPSDYEMIKQIVLQPVKSINRFYKIRMLSEDDKYTLDSFEA